MYKNKIDMKKTTIIALFLTASLGVMADDYQYLTVAQADKEQSVELASIQKITFEVAQGNVVVTTTEGEVRFPINEMEKMYFSATATAVKALPTKSKALSFARNELTVNGTGMLYVYAANGAVVRMARMEGKTNVNLGNLPQGTYVVKFGDQTIKVQK